MEKYKLFDATDFFEDIVNEISQAKEKIFLQAMLLELDKDMSQFIDEVKNALKRNVDVRFNIDWYSKLVVEDYPRAIKISDPVLAGYIKERQVFNDDTLRHLESLGVKITYTNPPKFDLIKYYPVFGRNHTKIYLIDNICYFGGMNFYTRAFKNIDFMIKSDYTPLVGTLYKIFSRINENNPASDFYIQLDKDSKLFIDRGTTGKSIIYTQALNTASKAENEIIYISQHLPDYKLLNIMNKAKARNIKIDILEYDISIVTTKLLQRKIEKSLFRIFNKNLHPISNKKYLHAKAIISDRKEVLFGSHNFSIFGVLFGTNEIALRSTDIELINLILHWYESLEI